MAAKHGRHLTEEIRQQIIEAYQGREQIEGRAMARLFLWQEGDKVMLGNTYAFAKFIGFSWSTVHAVLREAGEQLWTSARVSRGDIVNEFQEPEAYAEVVRVIPPEENVRTRKQVIDEMALLQVRMNELMNELLAMEEDK
jgi:hypothetical protein